MPQPAQEIRDRYLEYDPRADQAVGDDRLLDGRDRAAHRGRVRRRRTIRTAPWATDGSKASRTERVPPHPPPTASGAELAPPHPPVGPYTRAKSP